MFKNSAALLLTALFLQGSSPIFSDYAFAETPDEFNQCTNTGAGAKRENAINQDRHNKMTNAGVSKQQQMGDCFDEQIGTIMTTGSNSGGVPTSNTVDYHTLMDIFKQQACEALEDAVAEYGDIFDIVKIMQKGDISNINMDEISKQLMGLLKDQMKNIQKGQVKFDIPDVSGLGVDNVMQYIVLE